VEGTGNRGAQSNVRSNKGCSARDGMGWGCKKDELRQLPGKRAKGEKGPGVPLCMNLHVWKDRGCDQKSEKGAE